MLIFWTIAIAVITAIACSICGVFLVVKREAFISEGLSHAVLPGIVTAFIIFRDRNPFGLIIAAGLTGLVMVWLVRLLCKTNRVEQDAALGIVFSGLFSFGIILSKLELRNTHFHAHCIIDGNLSYAPLKSFMLGDLYLGPQAFVTMSAILILLVAFITIFFKVLKLSAFDPTLAHLLGFRPTLISTVWLSLVSMTAVAAFDTAGTILVVALMITPPATANLLTNSLLKMLVISGLLASAAAAGGIYLGLLLDISYAGPIASVSGAIFLLVTILKAKKFKSLTEVEVP